VLGKSLGHKDMASTMVYARLDLDPVRASMQKATAALFVAGGLAKSGSVTPLRRKRVAR